MILLFFNEYVAILLGIIIYGILTYFKEKEPEKKKLVITARVKRLFVTIAVLYVITVGIGVFFSMGEESTLVPLFILTIASTVLAYIYTLAANVINWPMEGQINQYYYNDAEKIISSMPHLEVVGITGSYGKTSTKHIVEKVLASEFNVLMIPERYNKKMGDTKYFYRGNGCETRK